MWSNMVRHGMMTCSEMAGFSPATPAAASTLVSTFTHSTIDAAHEYIEHWFMSASAHTAHML